MAFGFGPLGPDSTGAGVGGVPAGVVADLPAGEDEGAGWGPDPPAGATPADALDASEERGLSYTNEVRAQKLNIIMKSSEKTTYTKSYHSPLPRAIGGTPFPAEDPPDFWWRSPAVGAPGGGGGVCGLGSDGGGGVARRRVVGGGGGICCSGEGRRASSGLPSSCWRCGGGGGALLCLSASAVFWRLGAGSPKKEPSPHWSLRALDPSAWLLRAGAAPYASSSLWVGAAPTLSL
jgi:hypothetical protein